MPRHSIPKKRKQFEEPKTTLNPEDAEFLNDLPKEMAGRAACFIARVAEVRDRQINAARLCFESQISNYIANVRSLNIRVRDAIDKAFNSESKKFVFTFKGFYPSYTKQPSMDYWLSYNSAEADVLNTIIDELQSAGWFPRYELSPYSYDYDDCVYSGGKSVTLTCDFNQ